MFLPEYDSITGLPSHWSWALPGTLPSAAAWRILKWSWSGTTGTALWADGNDNLDNVRDDRAALTYVANAALSVEEASYYDVVPSGIPASSFDVGFTIPDKAVPWLDSTPMRRVGSAPVGNQFAVSGTTFETGVVVGTGAWLFLRVPLA